MHVPNHIKERVEQKLVDCIEIAEKAFNQKFLFPQVLYTKRGTTAGTANTNDWNVNFNSVLLMENIEAFIARTVPHEMAHLIDSQVNPHNFVGIGKRSIHGPTWKSIMKLLGAPVSRCHSYDVSTAKIKKRTQAKHVWVCQDCGTEMKLGYKRHGWMIGGRKRYWMRGCGHHKSGYQYVGKEGETSVPDLLPKAADSASPKPNRESKYAQCKYLYLLHNGTKTRKDIINLFVREVGCTNAGASTYYQKIRKDNLGV